MELLWISLALVALQPLFQRKVLEATRRRLLSRLEKKRHSRVIILAHRQETMSLLGFPVMRYIDVNDSEEILRAIHLTDHDVPIDLVLHTPGGLVLAALQIARAIKRHPAKVTVHVPHYAMSGGTLIALAADEVVMDENAVLGPVDPQLGGYPAASLLKAVAAKEPKDLNDETLILADQAAMSLRQVKAAVIELIGTKCSPEQAEGLASSLSEGHWTHDHPFTWEDARRRCLPVSNEIPSEVMKLMTLYPQPVRTSSSVEYLPGQRGLAAGD